MSSIAILALFLSYLLWPASPVTWLLLAITFLFLLRDSRDIVADFRRLARL